MRDGRPAGVIKVTEISAHILVALALPAAAAEFVSAIVVDAYAGDAIAVRLGVGGNGGRLEG